MTVEKDHGEEVFMPEPPEHLLRVSKSHVPLMMGMNSGEGLMYVDDPSGKIKKLIVNSLKDKKVFVYCRLLSWF